MKMVLPTLLLCIFMSGCFKNEPPMCSDKEVEQTLKGLYLKALDNIHNSQNPFLATFTQALPKNIKKLSSARAIAYDENIEMRTCKADALFDNNQTAVINYTIQVNEEDRGDYYIELDTEFIEGIMQENIMQGVFNQ